MKLQRLSYGLLLYALFLTGCSTEEENNTVPAVARVGEATISVSSFRSQYVDYLLTTGLQDNSRNRSQFLNTLVAAKQIVLEAIDDGIRETNAFHSAKEKISKKLLVESFLKESVYDALEITEEDARDYYFRSQTTLTARHLYTRTVEEANQIYSRLMAGASFEELASELFDDPKLSETGGMLGTFSVDEMDPAFENMAYSLEIGEISEPVRTRTGYSIIQVLDRSEKPLVTEVEYAQKRDNMFQYARYRMMNEARETFQDDLLGELSVSFDSAGITRLLDQILGADRIPMNEESAMETPLVSFNVLDNRETWTLSRFRENAQYTSEEQRAKVRDREGLEAFVKGLLLREAMIIRAEQAGLDSRKDFKSAFEDAMEKWIWDTATVQLIEAIPVPLDSSRAYYAAYGHEFSTPEMVRVWEVLVETREVAEQVLDQLRSDSFEEVARLYSRRPGAYEAGGDLGYLTAEQLGFWAEEVLASSEGTLLGPRELDGHHIILKVGDRIPSKPLSFEDALHEIEKRFRQKNTPIVLREHLEDLEQVYPVAKYDSMLQALTLREQTLSAATQQ